MINGILIIIASIIILEFLDIAGLINSVLIPSPFETLSTGFKMIINGTIVDDFTATFIRVFYAFSISTIMGIPLGLGLGYNKWIYNSFEIIIDFLRSIPATSVFPIFLLIFGIGDLSKISASIFAGIFIIIFNTAYGVRTSKKHRRLSLELIGATRFQIFKHVIFWETLPYIFLGLRNSLSLSLVVIIVTEMFIGSGLGLGRSIVDFQMVYDLKAMYATVIIVGLLGFFLNYIFVKLETKILHWK